MPLSKESYDTIYEALHKTAVINKDELKKYLLKKSSLQVNHSQNGSRSNRETKSSNRIAFGYGAVTAANVCI